MKAVTATFLSVILVVSFGCEFSQSPAVHPTSPLQRSDNMDVNPDETDSPFQLLEGYQVRPARKRDQTA